MTAYDDLPRELRALIWEKRTELRKDAATIIFRNLVRNLITNYLKRTLEALAGVNEHVIYIPAGANQYYDGSTCAFAELDKVHGFVVYANEFFTDMRNILLHYDNYQLDFGNVYFTDAICEAREEFKARS